MTIEFVDPDTTVEIVSPAALAWACVKLGVFVACCAGLVLALRRWIEGR